MRQSLSGPGIVLALVLAETAVGGAAVLWSSRTWGVARPAFYKLVGAVLAACMILAWLAARGPLGTDGARGRAAALLAIAAAVAVVWQVLLWAGAGGASRVAGLAMIPAGVAALVALAAIPGARSNAALGAFQLLAGALFAGAVTVGLLLGHWYLVEKRLSRIPLKRTNQTFIAGCVLAVVATIAGGTGGGEARAEFSPLLGVGALAVALAVGLVAICGLIAFFIRALVKEDSIQAATGFFYLAVIMALAAEFAAKVRFF